jgi:hypothetical protein
MGRACNTHELEEGFVYDFSLGKPCGKRALRKPSCKWELNNNIDLPEIE